MAEVNNVVVKVISQKGHCDAGHKVGDEWVVGNTTPGGMCHAAWMAIYPHIRVLQFGGTMPWLTDPDVVSAVCSDPNNPLILELRRIPK